MAHSFPIDSPPGTWWQIRTFDLCEHIEPRNAFWNDSRNEKVNGIALLQYTLRGKMLYRDRHGARDVPPGWAFLYLSGEDNAYGFAPDSHEPLETLWISFSGAGVPEHWNELRARFGPVVHLGRKCSVLEHIRALCRIQRPRNTSESVQRSADVHSFFRHLFTFLEGASVSGKSLIDRAIDELVNCADGNLSVKEVAARHGISREHFTRVFSSRQKISPARYLARAKLVRATALLTETQLPVTAVAKQCGFGSKQALIRWMRREAGCLPSDVRRGRRRSIRQRQTN